MGDKTGIRWTDHMWNPTTGCTKVSLGCKNCYAERMAKRLAGRIGYPEAPHQFDLTLHPERLDLPLHWKKPSMIFVDSMSDLFHDDIDDKFIDSVFVIMKMAWRHTFQILTKRPKRMYEYLTRWTVGGWSTREIIKHNAISKYGPTSTSENIVWPLRNLWLGVSCENQATADERIPWLLKTPAVVRFVSCEPMLERIDLFKAAGCDAKINQAPNFSWVGSGISWVICGGESGPRHRPHPPYIDVRYLKDQCVRTGVPFFLKQMWSKKMPELDGHVWAEMPKGGG
jgi:protein gp37